MKSLPISTKERIVTIDIIRGFALLGIFLVNMPAYHSPDFLMQLYGIHKEQKGIDYWVDLFLQLFIQMKFYTIFSFLFGLGFYIFMSRAEQKGLATGRLFTRRIFALFLFGAAHLILLWFGDILHVYAITGLLLLFFYKRENKTLLAWAFSLLFVIHALMSIQFFIPASTLEEMKEASQQDHSGKLTEYMQVYGNANYAEWVSYRFDTEIIPILMNLPVTMTMVLAMFLFGLYAGRMGFFQPDTPHLHFIKKTQMITFLLSVPLVIFLALLKLHIVDPGIYRQAAVQLFTSLSGMTLCFFYISSLTLLVRNERWHKMLRPLGYAGQMALTNYLSQTIICIILFVGFGFYGKISLAAGTLICLLIYVLQITFSYIWLKRYKFGPTEWLWRSFTYGYFQPMKKEQNLKGDVKGTTM
ncbi:DUF418 domain-containing protein [Bacillus songklensis]|uniref:DUF418 domain-containing protein n=1 Tax=Bacillus songklensis TaxID=1069116 RepID=A0ABV8B6J4_9BACI